MNIFHFGEFLEQTVFCQFCCDPQLHRGEGAFRQKARSHRTILYEAAAVNGRPCVITRVAGKFRTVEATGTAEGTDGGFEG